MLSDVNLLMTIKSVTCDHGEVLINQQRRSMATAAKTTLYKELRRSLNFITNVLSLFFEYFVHTGWARNTADVDFFSFMSTRN